MIPVVMLGIKIGALSSLFLTLFYLTLTYLFEYILVIYLITVTARAIEFISYNQTGYIRLHLLIDIAQVAHVTLSLLINISATSIIALKAWCVRFDGVFGKHIVDYALIDDTMHAYIQEIPQVAGGERDECPNPFTGNQDIGSPGRVGCDLYSDWCKFRLDV
jgi:hypothetical protein